MRAHLSSPVRLLCLVFAAVLGSGCAPTRIEHYYVPETAPAVSHDDVTITLLYFKQSQRHFYATARLTNTGTAPLTMQRTGSEAATVTLTAEGLKQLSDAPTRSTWTPWTGTVEHSNEYIARAELAPGASREFSLRWEFPTTLSTYGFDWSITVHGLRRETGMVPDLVLQAPADR